MKKLIKRVTQIVVLPEGEPIFSAYATTIAIEDEAAGEYVAVRTNLDFGSGTSDQEIRIDPQEWPIIRDAIEDMMGEIREYEKTINSPKQ